MEIRHRPWTDSKWPRFHDRRSLCCEEACFERERFHAWNSNLSTKELLQILDRNLREVCTTPWCIYQPAVRRLVGLLAFDEEPLGIQHSNYFNMSVFRETRHFNVLDTYYRILTFLSRTIALASRFRSFVFMSTLRLLNLEIDLSAYFESIRKSTAKKTVSRKPGTETGWEDHWTNTFF